MSTEAKEWLNKIKALPVTGPVNIMNVCGGHERTLSHAAIRSVLPKHIELIPGPGCPVCICPEEDIYTAIQWALNEDITLVSFGDMLHVPVNVSKSEPRSLEQARALGADVRPISSPREAVRIAAQQPDRTVVFFAVGFETTMAPIAAMIAQGVPDNLLLLVSGRRTWPAVDMLLQTGQARFNALIAPGHVATIIGADEWLPVCNEYKLAAAIAGFTTESLLAAIYSTLRQHNQHQAFLDNCYSEIVTNAGNLTARETLNKVFSVNDSKWRGIGTINQSGYSLNDDYQHLDARLRFQSAYRTDNRIGEMPPGCDCADVVLGKRYPNQCRIYGKACTPQTPIGPCMVSDEGACRIWWQTKTQIAV